jgi:uncharacterized protein (TIGR02284 family)
VIQKLFVMNQNELLANTLNRLLCINCDRLRGYENAIETVEKLENLGLQKVFKQHAALSRKYATHWGQIIRGLGSEPVTDPYKYEVVFRGWVDFTSSFSGYSCKSLLHFCARGEKAALEGYKEILRTADYLPASIQEEVQYQKSKIYTAQVSIVTMAIYVTTFERVYNHSSVLT